jgi:hypothetical protein
VVDGTARELGRYSSAEGERVLCAVLHADRSSWSVIDALAEDEEQSDPRLIEPHVDSLAQAKALGRDYLPRARSARRPLRRSSPPS